MASSRASGSRSSSRPCSSGSSAALSRGSADSPPSTKGKGLPPSTCWIRADRKSTRLNSSHLVISYAVFCLKKKKVRADGQARGCSRPSRASDHQWVQPQGLARQRSLPRFDPQNCVVSGDSQGDVAELTLTQS